LGQLFYTLHLPQRLEALEAITTKVIFLGRR
jgi:hypothetical protein